MPTFGIDNIDTIAACRYRQLSSGFTMKYVCVSSHFLPAFLLLHPPTSKKQTLLFIAAEKKQFFYEIGKKN